MIDHLKRELKQFQRLALVKYDAFETDPATLRNRLALTIDNRVARENPVRLTEDYLSVQARAWDDQIVASGAIDKLDYVVPMRGYHAFVPYDKVNIGRPNTVATLQRIAEKLPLALIRLQNKLLMNVFRLNPLTVDGQNFFSNSHAHIQGGAYDNLLSFTAGHATNITFDEAKAILHQAMVALAENQSLEAEVVDAAELDTNLIVTVHNATHFGIFDLVRTQAIRNNVENELKGKFILQLDRNPASGTETDLEVTYSAPNGPRPAFFIPDTSPVLEAWEGNEVPAGHVAVGIKEQFGIKPAHAHTSVRVVVGT